MLNIISPNIIIFVGKYAVYARYARTTTAATKIESVDAPLPPAAVLAHAFVVASKVLPVLQVAHCPSFVRVVAQVLQPVALVVSAVHANALHAPSLSPLPALHVLHSLSFVNGLAQVLHPVAFAVSTVHVHAAHFPVEAFLTAPVLHVPHSPSIV